jgi:hypothetical protein
MSDHSPWPSFVMLRDVQQSQWHQPCQARVPCMNRPDMPMGLQPHGCEDIPGGELCAELN